MISRDIIDMSSPINYFSSQYSGFLAGETSLQNKSRTNQVCEMRLIPGLKLFSFREYWPMYINDIVNTSSLLELILFADDTTLLFSHPDIVSKHEIINNELQKICNWFQANKLSVNASKTNYMVLGTHYSTRKFINNNQDIDILKDSKSTNSRDVEKVELHI